MLKAETLRDHGLDTDNRTYVIAEIGINHGGDADAARLLIDSAARTGCDAVKFQTYLTEQRAPKGNQAVFDILKKHELPLEAFEGLKNHAEERGVTFFSTPFDAESVACLEAIGCPLYKIASFDTVNKALLRSVAATGRPVIMSVGMSSLEEIATARNLLLEGTRNVLLLHCISAYPLEENKAELAAMGELQSAFGGVVGYSDHTPGIQVPLYAVAAGAQVIEKHYKIDADMECIDAPVSITEADMKTMVAEIRRIEAVLGTGRLGVREVEEPITAFRRPTA